MGQIVIQNLSKKTIQVRDFSKSILRLLQDNNIDWMQACGGKGRCTTCMFQIVLGAENLEGKTEAELKYERLGALKAMERLACQAKVTGDIVISVPTENKLPHLKYSD
jgi:2Fe-2S ferredoxin